MDNPEYQKALAEALAAWGAWFERGDLGKLKEECQNLHTAFQSLYRQFIQKSLVQEDPYKQEAKAGEIIVPDAITGEGDRARQLTVNLSAYDNQLDFLANFTQFTLDFFTNDTIKRILALLHYIDWTHFVADAPGFTTKTVVDLTVTLRGAGDTLAARVVADSINTMDKASAAVFGHLKALSTYNREAWKLALRQNVTGRMDAGDATQEGVRKRFAAACRGQPFYPELADEVIREDFSPGGEKLREKALKQLAVPETKQKAAKAEASFKATLLEGFALLGSVAVCLSDIAPKFDDNSAVLQSRKRGFFARIKALLHQMMSKEPEPAIYHIEYMDSDKGTTVRQDVNSAEFRADIDRKIRIYNGFSGRAGAPARLAAMEEAQLLPLLDRAIRDAQTALKTLTGLDEFFKTGTPKEARDRIKGIKPELSAMKNAIIKANQKRYEYSAQLEEEEQMRKLGVKT